MQRIGLLGGASWESTSHRHRVPGEGPRTLLDTRALHVDALLDASLSVPSRAEESLEEGAA